MKKPITSLSLFVIEKQIEALIGTPKSVKKMRNQTLLVETTRNIQTEQLLNCKTFFNLPVSEHKTLNSSNSIIRDKSLKDETEEGNKDYLKDQGVTAVKRFKTRKGHNLVSTNTLFAYIQFSSTTKISQNFLSNNSCRGVRTKSSEMFQQAEIIEAFKIYI